MKKEREKDRECLKKITFRRQSQFKMKNNRNCSQSASQPASQPSTHLLTHSQQPLVPLNVELFVIHLGISECISASVNESYNVRQCAFILPFSLLHYPSLSCLHVKQCCKVILSVISCSSFSILSLGQVGCLFFFFVPRDFSLTRITLPITIQSQPLPFSLSRARLVLKAGQGKKQKKKDRAREREIDSICCLFCQFSQQEQAHTVHVHVTVNDVEE